MAPLADFLLAAVPYRLPKYLYVYTPGITPLSTNTAVVAAIASYLAVIFGIQAVMKSQKQPLKLTTLFQIHNVILTSGSLLLLLLMLEEILPLWWNKGFHHALCSEQSWSSRMEFYYIVNYYFKYLEFIDTVFLALKKKPLQFLHVFHHSATALLCYTQLNGKTSISWAVITLNLFVHVIMYYYYFATAGGRRFWWKKYLTTMQIVQFVIDICLVYFGTYEHFVATRQPNPFPYISNCSGSEWSALFGCVLLTSYLGLFINFYFNTYKPAQAKKPAVNGTNGHANGHANGDKKN